MSRRKKKKSPEPPYRAWIVGHEVMREDPFVVHIIEAGGPVSTGMALTYLYRHFRIETTDEDLGMETHGVRPRRRWNLSWDSTDLVASEATREPIDTKALWPRLLEVTTRLGVAREQLNDALRRVERELLGRWPTAEAIVGLDVWKGHIQRLVWDKALYVETDGTQRKPLLKASLRLRILATDALAQLNDELQAA